jgi:hypothetical protein
MREMANPSGLIDRVRWKALQPMREYGHGLLRELLGPDATKQEVDYCELNLVGPCLMAQLTAQPRRSGAPLFTPVEVDSFADHCTEFVLAGVKTVRARRTCRQR